MRSSLKLGVSIKTEKYLLRGQILVGHPSKGNHTRRPFYFK